MKSYKGCSSNLRSDERRALTSLRARNDIMILPADKGNSTVILDKDDYSEKIWLHIHEGPYTEVKTDPGPRFRKRLVSLLRPLCDSGVLSRSIFCVSVRLNLILHISMAFLKSIRMATL